MKEKVSRWLNENLPVVCAIATILFLDRATKVWALLTLTRTPLEIFPFFHLRYVENTGMAFGLMQNGNRLLALIMMVIIAYIVYSWKELVSYGKMVKWASVLFWRAQSAIFMIE